MGRPAYLENQHSNCLPSEIGHQALILIYPKATKICFIQLYPKRSPISKYYVWRCLTSVNGRDIRWHLLFMKSFFSKSQLIFFPWWSHFPAIPPRFIYFLTLFDVRKNPVFRNPTAQTCIFQCGVVIWNLKKNGASVHTHAAKITPNIDNKNQET